jgi:hypothetical protein
MRFSLSHLAMPKLPGLVSLLAMLFVAENGTAQQSYTFTNCSATGSLGPSPALVTSAYLFTNLNGSVTSVNGIQSFTVSNTGNYRIEAIGAAGGTQSYSPGYPGGMGASMRGEFTFTAGTVLKILVGQKGEDTRVNTQDNAAPGGGGGSFVFYNATDPLPIIAAGGGGGGGRTPGLVGATTASNGNPALVGAAAGTGGNGGGPNFSGTGYWAGGGAGWLTDGTGGAQTVSYNYLGGTSGAAGGRRVANGGAGGIRYNDGTDEGGDGGFGGGGGGGSDDMGTGGGGGFSGGGGANRNNNANNTGGGGGSYNSGFNQVNTSSVNPGHGRVIITDLCAITLSATGTNSLDAICSGASVTLSTNGVGNYSWSTGNTTSSVVVVSPTITTVYSVTATSSMVCTALQLLTVTVYSSVPTMTISNTSSATNGVCPSKTVALSVSGAPVYSWSGGITNGSAFVATASNGYTVTGTNACGVNTATTFVNVFSPPTVGTVVSSPTLCSTNPTTLTAFGNATAYVWSGNVINGVGFFPSLTTVYTVTGTSAQGCTATSVVGITVVASPNIPPTASPSLICIGRSSTITSTGAANYTWLTPSGTFTTAVISVTPGTTTSYTLIRSNSNCQTIMTTSVFVNQLPTVFAVASPTLVCASKNSTLSGGGAISYTWNSSGPPTYSATGTNAVVSPSVSTLYTVTASDGTCVNTTTVFVATNPNPTVNITANTTVVCQGQSANLTASGGINYTWTSVQGSPTGNSIVVTPTASTMYQVVGDNSFNCKTIAQKVVIVNPVPSMNLYTTKPFVCAFDLVTLTVTGNANNYQWDPNAGGGTFSITTVSPLVTSVYSVTGTFSATGCSATNTIQILVYSPSITVNSPTSSCLGGTINLVATGALSYTWSNNQFTPQIPVSPPSATVYVVAATSQSNGIKCVSNHSISVSIYANPVITAVSQKTTICRGENTNLTATGGIVFNWSSGQTGSTVPVSPTVQSTFTVEGADANGCIGITTVLVRVSTCFGIAEKEFLFSGIRVSPNPSEGSFSIYSENTTSLVLVNGLGQVIRKIVFNADKNQSVDLEDFPPGIYYIFGENRLTNGGLKVIISK